MIPRSTRVSCLAIAAASLLFGSTARGDEPAASAAATPFIERPAPMPPAMPNVRRVDASEPRKITGMVLTAIGIFHGTVGTVTFTTFLTMDDGFGALLGLIIGGPLMGEGLILSCVGIPLWVSGAKTVVDVDQPAGAIKEPRDPRWVPSIEVGAGTGTATWRF